MTATSRGLTSLTDSVYKNIKPGTMARSTSPEGLGRSSFSSVRENDSGLAQVFTSSKVSSYSRAHEDAIDDSPSTDMTDVVDFVAPLTQPHSKLHGSWLPANSFKGWKQIQVRGKYASRSFSDLQALNFVWNQPAATTPPINATADVRLESQPGSSHMERLPIEILGAIIDLLFVEKPTHSKTTRNGDLRALLLTSKTLYAATLATLYRHITIPHSRIFRKFLSQISAYPALGLILRRLDFSHFNPGTLFFTAQERALTQNLTNETLLRCLELTPHLKEFLAQEHISENLGPKVLEKLFFGLPQLQAIDFCGCSDKNFKQSFESILPLQWPESLSITRLSFHKNIILPSKVFETIFPRLTRLTHLDVAGCRVTDAALQSIPHSARITHLNLAKCRMLSADAVIDFLAHHPAVVSSLVVLSLGTDAMSHEMLDADAVSRLITVLPRTLKSLSLKGSSMTAEHITMLRPLSLHLEELALGRNVSIEEINELFVGNQTHSLRYIDVSDLFGAKDLDPLFESRSSLFKESSAPLEVIEVSEKTFIRMKSSRAALTQVGWDLSEFGSRYWLVRANPNLPRGDPHRTWKLGADHWGARKIPVADAEVGGMYGSFMFERKL